MKKFKIPERLAAVGVVLAFGFVQAIPSIADVLTYNQEVALGTSRGFDINPAEGGRAGAQYYILNERTWYRSGANTIFVRIEESTSHASIWGEGVLKESGEGALKETSVKWYELAMCEGYEPPGFRWGVECGRMQRSRSGFLADWKPPRIGKYRPNGMSEGDVDFVISRLNEAVKRVPPSTRKNPCVKEECKHTRR